MRKVLGSWLGGRNEATRAKTFGDAEAAAFCQTYEALNLGGFWLSDADGSVSLLSENLRLVLSPDEDVIGKPILELFRQAGTPPRTSSSLALAMARQGQFENIILGTGSEENCRWWSVSGKAQYSASQEFIGFIGLCADITRVHSSAEENAELATKDALTGLLNRRHMSDLLKRNLAYCKTLELPCALLLLDLDRFKQINDTLGHSAGDNVLKQVAERLVSIVGSKDRISRLGGDEFQIILPEVEDRGALGELATAIISGLSQPYSVDGNRCTIGASVGIAVSPFDGSDSDELIRNADLALYAAKNGGRGRFRFFSAQLLRAAEDRRELEEDLHVAIARGEFELHYQPIVDSLTNTVTGAETLIRWNHPEKGRISPAVFIPIAEESNLIWRIGEWVLRTACEDAAAWPEKLRVAVNVSPVQFANESLPVIVTNALASSGLDPARLELEITESVFVQEGNGTDAMFKALKLLGVRLALDDFGTGYSSLSYLKTAPFDKIKIDQSFVRGATEEGSRNKAIIAAIVALAEAVDMETTAEGIETEDQLDMIRELKVSHVQGYIYSQGKTNEQFVGHLQDGSWVIKPTGPARQRHDRYATYRSIGAVHEDHYYQVVLRNLSRTGAMIEGLMDVPVDTQFVLDFGEGQLAVATVKRSDEASQGVEFETQLVDDGNCGLCTRSRVSPYYLAAAGLPHFVGEYVPDRDVNSGSRKIGLPAFSSKKDWLKASGLGTSRSS